VAGADGLVLRGVLGLDACDSGLEMPVLRDAMDRR
jgi:hypothetical protein